MTAKIYCDNRNVEVEFGNAKGFRGIDLELPADVKPLEFIEIIHRMIDEIVPINAARKMRRACLGVWSGV